MQSATDYEKLKEFLQKLSIQATGPGSVYLVGGASALALNFRNRTIDIDLKLDPEPSGALQAISRLKEEIGINVDLQWPGQFVPDLPGWRERSLYVTQLGEITVRHYDFYSQVLAKVERNHDRDRTDVNTYIQRGLVFPQELYSLFLEVREEFVKYPAVDVRSLEQRLNQLREKGQL